jgi:multiple sugar transport system permease protein
VKRAAARSPALRARRRRDFVRNVAFLSPWLLGTGLFFIYPLVTTAYLSFTHYDGFTSPTWVGLDNWSFVLRDYPFFWPALRNTVWFVVVIVTLRVLSGLVIGMLVIRIKRGGGVFRTLFYMPYLAPPVAGTLAFVFLLNPGTGPVNSILGKLGLPEPGWFNDPSWSKPALTLLALWGIGDLMVIFMASLLDVPRELYEAAELDGAPAYRRFLHVTLPHLRPILAFSVVTGIIAIRWWQGRWPADRSAARASRRSPGIRAVPPSPCPSWSTTWASSGSTSGPPAWSPSSCSRCRWCSRRS